MLLQPPLGWIKCLLRALRMFLYAVESRGVDWSRTVTPHHLNVLLQVLIGFGVNWKDKPVHRAYILQPPKANIVGMVLHFDRVKPSAAWRISDV